MFASSSTTATNAVGLGRRDSRLRKTLSCRALTAIRTRVALQRLYSITAQPSPMTRSSRPQRRLSSGWIFASLGHRPAGLSIPTSSPGQRLRPGARSKARCNWCPGRRSGICFMPGRRRSLSRSDSRSTRTCTPQFSSMNTATRNGRDIGRAFASDPMCNKKCGCHSESWSTDPSGFASMRSNQITPASPSL
jgi:hypothetical protein